MFCLETSSLTTLRGRHETVSKKSSENLPYGRQFFYACRWLTIFATLLPWTILSGWASKELKLFRHRSSHKRPCASHNLHETSTYFISRDPSPTLVIAVNRSRGILQKKKKWWFFPHSVFPPSLHTDPRNRRRAWKINRILFYIYARV